MTYKDALKRGLVTFYCSAAAAVPSSALFNIELWQAALTAGFAAVINWSVRLGQAYLDQKGSANA